MNPVPLFLIIVTLPLLLGGCGEKESVGKVKPEEPVAETKPELEGVTVEELELSGNYIHLKGSDTPYTGKAVGLWPNGQKKYETNYKDGKTDGLDAYWHENGQKLSEVNYKDGKPDGLVLQWHENGQKRMEDNYKDGKPDGLQVEWHENGQKFYELNFKNGERISEKYWNSKGEIVDSEEEARK